ncbi:MAG: AarF/ABC1/UbiB kinase family protein [Herbiconiux sp.]|uniref:ABC1 kinase family protein n=1 Tax=Herbiconiux sp. TaxID=1871186 RepID=UPI00121B6058|nr:AarF/UbiB family protein [Herbiconiux sp.]TAJ46619.1 MAG: AarF/ABC1/UbiB kinase family protein [Herbiconiux sp.]
MLTDVATVLLAVISAALVGFVARRILDTPVGWPRSIVVGLLVFVSGLPFASWVVDQTGLLDDGTVSGTRHALIVLAVLVLSVAWVFALGLAVLVALEALFPTRPLRSPVAVVRAAVRQRRRTRRYFQILSIASRHGAGWLFHGRSGDAGDLSTSAQRAQAIVSTINESGVSFVKLGQVLSTRRDLIPEPYLGALAPLQSGASTLPWETVRPLIEESIGAPLETVFRSIDPEPLAAASVAQVHAGVLNDGTAVVVKIQRPAARAQVEADVDIILRLAHRAESRTRAGHDLRLENMAKGFTTTLLDELDYGIEASNTEMIRSVLALIAEDDHGRSIPIAVPQIHREASGPRMLTMDLIDGVPLSRAASRLSDLTAGAREHLAVSLMTTVIEQILVHGVFHADLHPGNVILREDGSLGLIDFGAVGVIERSQRQHLAAVMLAATSEDDVAATDALLLIVDVPDDVDLDAFRHDIGVVLTSQRHLPSGDGSIFTRVVDVIRHHRIALPADLASAFRSFATLEGCLTVIVPDFDLVERAIPVVPRVLRHMVSAKQVATSAQAQAAVTASLVRGLPRRLDTLLSGLEKGSVGITLRAFRDESGQRFLREITSEIVGTLISIAAVVVAVVLLVTDTSPELATGLRLFDLLGALIGFFGFLGLLRVVRQIFVRRSRR